MRSGIKKFKGKNWKGKLRAMSAPHSRSLPDTTADAKICAMKLAATFLATLFSSFSLLSTASAQTPSPESPKPSDVPQLEALAKKIDEQNAKIDALSQEILKLEQQVSHIRPGVMIGEKENTPSSSAAAAPGESASHPVSGNTHTVARGETLTAIAKMYKVTIDELQKANNIEDGRKLQAGQTIVIPTSPSPALSASPAPSN
jgi:LysM repeat protein